MTHVGRYFEEINRVLMNNGSYILVSAFGSDFTSKYFEKVVDNLVRSTGRSKLWRFRR